MAISVRDVLAFMRGLGLSYTPSAAKFRGGEAMPNTILARRNGIS